VRVNVVARCCVDPLQNTFTVEISDVMHRDMTLENRSMPSKGGARSRLVSRLEELPGSERLCLTVTVLPSTRT
jgi:hypothetical protein